MITYKFKARSHLRLLKQTSFYSYLKLFYTIGYKHVQSEPQLQNSKCNTHSSKTFNFTCTNIILTTRTLTFTSLQQVKIEQFVCALHRHWAKILVIHPLSSHRLPTNNFKLNNREQRTKATWIRGHFYYPRMTLIT